MSKGASVLNRTFGLDRCPDKGTDGFERYVAWGMVANTLTRIGTTRVT